MKKKIFLLTLSTLIAIILIRCIYFIVCTATYTPQEGDMIFHVSESSQSAAIKIGTLSRYSHCGVIVMKKGEPYVLEAERGVELTPLSKWIKRGVMGNHYRVMRLKAPQALDMTYSHLLGIPYDKAFRFNNGKLYCSELVWEIYKDNGVMLCEPKQLSEYHFLNLPEVQKHIKNRGFKMDQKVVPPSDLTKSDQLKTVAYGYWKIF